MTRIWSASFIFGLLCGSQFSNGQTLVQLDPTSKECYVQDAGGLTDVTCWFSTVGFNFWYRMTSVARCDEFRWIGNNWVKQSDSWITTYAVTWSENCEASGSLQGFTYGEENELETYTQLILADAPAWVFPVEGWQWRSCEGETGSHSEYEVCDW